MKRMLRKNKLIFQIEKKEGEILEEILRHKFVDENKSMQQIANELNVTYLTVFRWLKKAGVYSRMLKL
ncbi:hypothetical protein [Dehalobacter sp. 14DCB1]|uniref:hypothetical protein n=1 Tax=Dehalobacter sp. 14DCB1 TaxID=2070227 RepID=UPI00035C1F94|nr:hypothetical protein [Dehalobacter sp. 14DCB1]TCX53797.1 hypothetical protein C1I36_03440 [Dehalobacter sp. 14DCB1]